MLKNWALSTAWCWEKITRMSLEMNKGPLRLDRAQIIRQGLLEISKAKARVVFLFPDPFHCPHQNLR